MILLNYKDPIIRHNGDQRSPGINSDGFNLIYVSALSADGLSGGDFSHDFSFAYIF